MKPINGRKRPSFQPTNSVKLYFHFLIFTAVFLLTACNGGDNALPTAVQPVVAPNGALPATIDISTAQPEQPVEATSAVQATAIQSGSVITDDDFLPIDAILSEIDNEVCQEAYETKVELEALIAEGADLAELETAIEELIAELENCPTPSP